MPASSGVRLFGFSELAKVFDQLPRSARGRIARAGVRAGANIISKAAKALLPRKSKDSSGLLRRSIGVRVATSRGTGQTYAVIGPRRRFGGEFQGRRRVPTKYAHFVEYGHFVGHSRKAAFRRLRETGNYRLGRLIKEHKMRQRNAAREARALRRSLEAGRINELRRRIELTKIRKGQDLDIRYIKARPFMRPAFYQNKAAAMAAMKVKIHADIHKEAVKLAAKHRRAG